MNARTFRLGGTRRLPTIILVARREVRMRLRSRVFVGGTIVMAVLVVVGIVAASLLAGRTTPVRVGFSGGSQALERSFTATAAALGANVTLSDIADVTAGKAQVTAGTLDVLLPDFAAIGTLHEAVGRLGYRLDGAGQWRGDVQYAGQLVRHVAGGLHWQFAWRSDARRQR